MRATVAIYQYGIFCCAALGGFANAAETTVFPAKDNTLYEDTAGTLSNGKGRYFFAGQVGATGAGGIRRGLLAFDIASAIPPLSEITAASLQLTMDKTNSGAAPVALHRATANWGEGSSIAAGEEGQGATATTDDATWTRRFFDTLSWTSPGGDYVAVASATQSVAGNGNYTWSSAGVLQDVQLWHATPSTNFGWVVVGDESTLSSAKRFASREHATAANRPALTVTYTAVTAVRDWTLY